VGLAWECHEEMEGDRRKRGRMERIVFGRTAVATGRNHQREYPQQKGRGGDRQGRSVLPAGEDKKNGLRKERGGKRVGQEDQKETDCSVMINRKSVQRGKGERGSWSLRVGYGKSVKKPSFNDVKKENQQKKSGEE